MQIVDIPQYLWYFTFQFNVSQMSDKLPEMSEQEAFSVNLFYQFLLLATLNNPSEKHKTTVEDKICQALVYITFEGSFDCWLETRKVIWST